MRRSIAFIYRQILSSHRYRDGGFRRLNLYIITEFQTVIWFLSSDIYFKKQMTDFRSQRTAKNCYAIAKFASGSRFSPFPMWNQRGGYITNPCTTSTIIEM